MKKTAAFALVLSLLLTATSFSVYGADTRYADFCYVSCALNIADGFAECDTYGYCKDPFLTISVTTTLYCDDNDYATWSYSGTYSISELETCYVPQGHEYYLGSYIKATDANGNIIDECVCYTDLIVY